MTARLPRLVDESARARRLYSEIRKRVCGGSAEPHALAIFDAHVRIKIRALGSRPETCPAGEWVCAADQVARRRGVDLVDLADDLVYFWGRR